MTVCDPKALMQIIQATLKPLGWHVDSIQVNQSCNWPGSYSLTMNAVGPVHQPAVRANSGVKLPDIDPDPVCECGAAAAKTTHSSWCPLTAATKP